MSKCVLKRVRSIRVPPCEFCSGVGIQCVSVRLLEHQKEGVASKSLP